jgi:hypothetical protein
MVPDSGTNTVKSQSRNVFIQPFFGLSDPCYIQYSCVLPFLAARTAQDRLYPQLSLVY